MIERDPGLEKQCAHRSVSAENACLKFIEQIHPRLDSYLRLLNDRSIRSQQVLIRTRLFLRPNFATAICCPRAVLSPDIRLDYAREQKQESQSSYSRR